MGHEAVPSCSMPANGYKCRGHSSTKTLGHPCVSESMPKNLSKHMPTTRQHMSRRMPNSGLKKLFRSYADHYPEHLNCCNPAEHRTDTGPHTRLVFVALLRVSHAPVPLLTHLSGAGLASENVCNSRSGCPKHMLLPRVGRSPAALRPSNPHVDEKW